MHIQWFPGHMHKARVQMAETLPRVDLIIELLDARLPYSSENPMLAELRGPKPCLKILAKSDLADDVWTTRWLARLETEQGVRARAVSMHNRPNIGQLADVCLEMFPEKRAIGKQITALVVGIPNVGKSTLINILAGRKVAKTGNEPAVTKGQQRIRIGAHLVLWDSPGVLWPNVANEKSGYRLASVGSVKETAMEYEDVAFFAAEFLLDAYPRRLCDRYGFAALPGDPLSVLEAIGRQRGCLNKRGVVDYERASRILLTELRAGKLGGITLETPAMMDRERAEVSARRSAKESESARRKEERKQRFKASRKTNRNDP